MAEATYVLPKKLVNLATAQAWGTSRYLTPGKYLLTLKEIKRQESQNPDKSSSDYFIAIFNVEIAVYKDTEEKKFEEGDEASWIVDTSQSSAASNIIQFLLGLFPEKKQADLTDAFMASLFTQVPCPGAGRELSVNAYNIKTKKGGDFTKIEWKLSKKPEDGQTPVTPPAA